MKNVIRQEMPGSSIRTDKQSTGEQVFFIECVHCHRKSEIIQWIKSRNCDIIDDNKEDSSPSLSCVHCPKVELFIEMVPHKIIEPSYGMEPSFQWTSLVLQYGSRKIV